MVVCSDAGGVGKTMIASVIALGRPSARCAAFDRVEGGGASKFARLMKAAGRSAVVDLVSDHLPLQAPSSRDAAMARFTSFGEVIAAGDAVIDTGAKAASGLIDWALGWKVGDVLDPEQKPFLVVPAVATRTSVAAARRAIEGLAGQGGLARGRAFAVLNTVHGSFEHLEEDPDYLWLSAEAEAGRLGFVILPKCEGEVLPMVEAGSLSLVEALAIAPAAFAARAGVSHLRAMWSLRGFASFALVALEAFAAAGFVPRPVRERARLAALDAAWRMAAAEARLDILGRVEAQVAGRLGLSPRQVMGDILDDDARMLVEVFPDLLKAIMAEVAIAARRGIVPDFVAQRRGLEAAVEAARQRRHAAASGIEPRLGGLRRDVVMEANRHGLAATDHRVAAVSYVRDLEEVGWRALPRALAFIGRYHVETALIRVGLLRERSPVPKMR